MPKRCCLCGSNDVHLFQFPSQQPFLSKWKEFVGKPEISSSTKLCIKHFSEDAIVSHPIGKKPKRVRLHHDAIPSKNRQINSANYYVSKNSYVCLICKSHNNDRLYFRFPSDIQRRNEWLRRCGYDSQFFNGEKEWYLCNIHFLDSDILKKQYPKGRHYLRRNALPSIFIKTEESNDVFLSPEQTYDTEIITLTGETVSAPCSPSSSVEFLDVMQCTDENDVLCNDLLTPANDSCLVIENDTENTTSHNSCFSNHTLPTTIDELLATHNNCPICTDFISHFTSTISASDISSFPSKIPSKRLITYVGDVQLSDLNSPERAKRAFLIAKEKVLKYRRKVDILRKRMKRLESNTKKYKELITRSKSEGFMSDDVYSTLAVN